MWSYFIFSSGLPLLFFALALLWSLGGYLIARLVFFVSARESLAVGIGLGSLLVIVLTNLASHWLSLQWAYLLATMLIIGAGGISVIFNRRGDVFENWQQALPPFFAFLLLFVLFLKINQGLAIFDENYNLPIVSLIAAGDVPPRFPFNPSQPLAYHYGLHLLAGVAVRFVGISPWLAFDAVRAYTHALMVVLATLWFERKTGSFWAAVMGGGVVYFGGNTQWLLLFAPQPWLKKLSAMVALSNTALSSGKNLYDLLMKSWNIDGLGVVSFPFAFIGAVFKPQNLALTSNGAAVALTILLLLLLAPKNWRLGNIAFVSLILASLALTAEYLFGLLVIGTGLIAVYYAMRQKSFSPIFHQVLLWTPALGLAFFAGGVISVMAQHFLRRMNGQGSVSGHGFLGFEWQSPPSLPTLYFGRLSLIQADTLVFSLILLGPIFFLVLLSFKQLKNQWRLMDLIQQSLLIGASVCFLLSLIVGIKDSLGGITRLLDTALVIFLILCFPSLINLWEKRLRFLQTLIVLNLFLLCLGGIVTFSLEFIAIPRPQYTVYVSDLDVRFYTRYWNRLSPQTQIFDPSPERSIVLFGRSAGLIASDYGKWLPEWQETLEGPTPTRLLQAGYTHAYIDKSFWSKLTLPLKSAWEERCVRLVEEQNLDFDFRRLYDLRACR